MSGVGRKKQDDKYLTALRELVNTGGGGNRQCFDCGQKGPTYVNMTIGSFVCTRCSGVLRGLTPPHRVKSISMATFTQEEIDFLKAHGNDDCAKTWLGLWDPKRAVHQDHRELMIDKYERKRYYLEPASPLKSLTNAASLKSTSSQSTTSQTNGNQTTAALSNGHKPLNGTTGSNGLDNGFHSIQLTPPTSQRTTSNGLQQHKSSSSAISRPHLQQNGSFSHHQDAFMLSNSNNNNNNNNHHNNHHGYTASAGSTSTGALSDTSSCASNGFGPEADFVADFGSANIFDATSASSVGSPAVSSASSVASSNGYAKIQPIKAAHQRQHQQQFANGQQQQQQFNGTGSTMNGNTENFADFDHAPIYNAADNYQFISKSNLNKISQQEKQPKQHQQSQQQFSTTTFPNNSRNNSYATNDDVEFIRDRFNDDNDDDVIGTLSTIIGNGSTPKSRNIIYSESTSNFNDPFADFENAANKNSNIIVNSTNRTNNFNNRNNKSKFVTFECDFGLNGAQQQQPTLPPPPPQQQQQQHQLSNEQQQQLQYRSTSTPNGLSSMKFTPLAMAAHATAMAVLGSDYHFNQYNSNNKHNNNNTTNDESRIKYDSNINKNFNTYRNPFDTEQWDVWEEVNLHDNTNNQSTSDSWTKIVPSNFESNNNKKNNNNYNNNNNNNNSSHYIALSEFRTASPVSQSSGAWLNTTANNRNNSTLREETVAIPETDSKTISNILTPTTISAGTTTNHNNKSISTLPQSMSFPSNNQSNNVVHQPTMFHTSIPSYSYSCSLSLSSYPSTNPFRTDYLQESFTNCDNSCKIENTFTTCTLTATTSSCTDTISCNTNITTITTTITTTSTNSTTTTMCSISSCDMPLEVLAPTLSSPFNSLNSTSSTRIVANANFHSDYDSNRVSSDGWRAIPIPNGNHKNSFTASNNNHNNKLSSTPSEDRYAALKDLDEQLRESKTIVSVPAGGTTILDSFGNNNNNNNNTLSMSNGGNVNPFKSQQPNPFQMATANNPQHHQQQQNLYGQLTVISNGMISGSAPTTNGFGVQQQTPPQPTAFFNYSNGFTSASLHGGLNAGQTSYPTMASSSGPSGCGFGFGAMSATGVGTVNGVGSVGAYVNPFAAAGALNTNNPFL